MARILGSKNIEYIYEDTVFTDGGINIPVKHIGANDSIDLYCIGKRQGTLNSLRVPFLLALGFSPRRNTPGDYLKPRA